ncbi:MAG: NUDIX domain-containing protein [Chloroflexi bacterium]|nr:NUDIX domain-containing protein [Chloroflexota bacterium]
MTNFLGVGIAILENEKILLVKREDFEVWVLPGGMVDPGESLAQAAIREAKEETGLDVRLTRLVGLYSMLGIEGSSGHHVVFAAEPIGGELCPQPEEVIDLGFFAPNQLPEPQINWWRQRIRDVFAGVGGSAVWTQKAAFPFGPAFDRQALYRQRDASGLSRSEYFSQLSGTPESLQEHPDLPGIPLTLRHSKATS